MKHRNNITRIVCSALVMLVFALSAAPRTKTFKVKNFPIQFTLPANWKQNKKDNPFDLQLTDKIAYLSVFAFKRADLAKDQSPYSIFTIQNDDIMGKQPNKELISSTVVSHSTLARTSQLYSAVNQGDTMCYYCNLIEFPKNPEVFMWVLITAVPWYANKSVDNWNELLSSAKVVAK